MLVKLEKITIQNFLSYGKKPVEFNVEEGIDLVTAGNGQGKSAIFLDAVMFGFFGKPFRKIKLGSLVNKINKQNLLVTLDFSIGENSFRVERGLAPNVFNLFQNDELIDQQAANRDYQKFLEENIIRTTENIFRQIIILGANITTSRNFMDLNPKEKEEIFQKITDTKIFNTMTGIIDVRVKKLKTSIQELSYKKKILESNISSLKESIKHIEQQNEFYFNKREETILGKTQEISNLECENENLLINLKYLASQKKILDEKNKFHEELVATINNIKSSKEYTENILRKIEFAEEHVVTCSNCNHKVFPDLDIDVSKKEEVLASINEYESSLKEKMEIISILNSELNSLKQELLGGKILKQTIELNKEKIVKLKEELDEIQKYIPSVQDNVSLIDMEKTLVEVKQELDIIYKEKDDLDFIQNAISSDNIKGLIISQELPFLNKFINEYLEKFSLIGYNLIIDKNFKDKIISRTEDNEYNQMSNGQKARINFSIMFALLKMVEQRNGVSFNILVLDEVLDSSLDSLGREELLGILYSDFRQNKNVIIISHNQEIKEKLEFFSRIIEIEMNTFSSINISKV